MQDCWTVNSASRSISTLANKLSWILVCCACKKMCVLGSNCRGGASPVKLEPVVDLIDMCKKYFPWLFLLVSSIFSCFSCVSSGKWYIYIYTIIYQSFFQWKRKLIFPTSLGWDMLVRFSYHIMFVYSMTPPYCFFSSPTLNGSYAKPFLNSERTPTYPWSIPQTSPNPQMKGIPS